MSNKILFVLWLSAWVLLFDQPGNAQSTTPIDLRDAQTEIEGNNLIYFKALCQKDSTLFNSLYTTDCWIMTPGAFVYCGPDAASEYFVYASKNRGIRNGKFITSNVYGISTDMIAEVGFYELFNAENVSFEDGKYIVLWKRVGKAWKRFRDSFSSSRNAAATVMVLHCAAQGRTPAVPPAVSKAFVRQFPAGRLKKWAQKKEEYMAIFRQNGKKYIAYYTSGGVWDSTESLVKWTRDLPLAVRAGWDHCKYMDWLILGMKRIETSEKTHYAIHVGQVQSLGPDDADIGSEYVLYFSDKGELVVANNLLY